MAKRRNVRIKYVYMRPPETTGVIKVFDYLIGFVVFALVWLLLNDPASILYNIFPNISNAEWPMFLWAGSLVVYLVFGTFFFLSSLREDSGGW